MEYVEALLSNRMLIAAVIGWASAQIIKTVINCIINKSFSFERLVGSGGMPSSHSAFVAALAVSVFKYEGPDTAIFAACFVMAFIVMYDAMGVRRETGKQAELLNQITQIFSANYAEFDTPERALKELVGHTPLQVFFGGLLGILVGIMV